MFNMEINESYTNKDQLLEIPKIVDNKLCSAIKSGNIKEIVILCENGANIQICSCHISPIYFALKLQKNNIVDYLLKHGAHFGVIKVAGPFSGFTALHHVCIEGDVKMAYQLLDNYHVDPTAEADDGVQPLQLAVLRRHFQIIFKILKAGASVETKLSYYLHQKYGLYTNNWNHNFGNQMTLFTYEMFNNDPKDTVGDIQTSQFLDYHPNLKISDKNNKTLMMFAMENDQFHLAIKMIQQSSVQEINTRDNTGFAAIHYLVSPRKFGQYEDDEEQRISDIFMESILELLDEQGANINLMINNDPKTLPIYMAAYHRFPFRLAFFLPKQTFFTPLAQPLFYAIQDYIIDSSEYNQSFKPLDDTRIIATVKIIIEDIYVKGLCKYPVHKNEIKLMEQLIKNEIVIKEFVKKLEEKYNELFSTMKKFTTNFGNQKISLYEIVMAPQKEYIKVAKNENYNFDNQNFGIKRDDESILYLRKMVRERLYVTKKRIYLLGKWENIVGSIIKSLFLPYDCVLYIVECMNNNDLENFIEAYTIH